MCADHSEKMIIAIRKSFCNVGEGEKTAASNEKALDNKIQDVGEFDSNPACEIKSERRERFTHEGRTLEVRFHYNKSPMESRSKGREEEGKPVGPDGEGRAVRIEGLEKNWRPGENGEKEGLCQEGTDVCAGMPSKERQLQEIKRNCSGLIILRTKEANRE